MQGGRKLEGQNIVQNYLRGVGRKKKGVHLREIKNSAPEVAKQGG